MAVPTIALYASPPNSVCCSTPYPSQINAQTSYDFDLITRPACSTAVASPASSSQRPMVGGLSTLFSSSGTCSVGVPEELPSLRGADELSSSFSYSPFGSCMKRDHIHQSPVSVFHGPGSLSSTPPMRFTPEREGSVRGWGRRQSKGFVTHALGSSVDYDSPSFQVHDNSADDLPFVMDDNLKFPPPDHVDDLLSGAQRRHSVFHDDLVIKAFCEAEKAHRNQKRLSGHPYLQHCVETAVLLSEIGANATIVAAGLLHDTLDDSDMTYAHIFQTFGAEVADLVAGVSKLSQLSKLARESNTATRNVEADRLHTMFLAMVDPSAVLIKLADRLHNMMTLDALSLIKQEKQQRFAMETMEIFVPLANRLGIRSWNEQLENLCFKYLNPVEHKDLSSQHSNSFDEVVTSAKEKLEQALKDEGFSYHNLYGRQKSLYSIHRKMEKKKRTVDAILDIHGLRLIVENEEDCYRALKIVHKLWPEVPGSFKDYLTHPKCNGYQSLHTVVTGEHSSPLEVQIRTKKMDLQAEFGFAAHWRYKEGDCQHSSFVLQRVEWARWVLSWKCEIMNQDKSCIDYAKSLKPPETFPFHSENCPHSYKPSCPSDGPVIVLMFENNKMTVEEFPADSTVKDLLNRAGRAFPLKQELRPRVNHKPVSDSSLKLKMGDAVELTPSIPDESLPLYRKEIQRMYDSELAVTSSN